MTLVIRIPTAVEEMIFQCCKSFLFCEGHPWVKIGTENFDTAMGSYMGAELCEMVGLYILHKLTSGKEPLFEKRHVGLNLTSFELNLAFHYLLLLANQLCLPPGLYLSLLR